MEHSFDLLVIGGGVNGTSVARDAAGRGLSVLLCEKDDLAAHTSSASTKLIHGGLRYLEYYEFRLVREALSEREILYKAAPHIVWPLRFVLPHVKGLRPKWMLRAGLFLYDYIGKRKLLPPTKTVNLEKHDAGKPLKKGFKYGFVYSDAWVMDARIVMLSAKDAQNHGADIRTRCEVKKAQNTGDGWKVEIYDKNTAQSSEVFVKTIVNAAGPWVKEILSKDKVDFETKESVRHVQGSHIVVPKLFDHPFCYIFQNPDNRIIFAIPYEGEFTLIGTTDVDYDGDLDNVVCTQGEIDYLCSAASEYFAQGITADDVVWHYSGVRPLYDDGSSKAQAATRDFVLSLDAPDGNADGAILNIFGGKITAARELGEKVMHKVAPLFNNNHGDWTAEHTLPGGDMGLDFDGYLNDFQNTYPWLPKEVAHHYVRHYGSCAHDIVKDMTSIDDLGQHFEGVCYAAELKYSIAEEFTQTAEDFLWRRTKLGLHLSKEAQDAIHQWFQGQG